MKKTIKFLLLTGIIISLLIPMFGLAGKKYKENDILVGMLKELEGEFLEGDINMGGIILEEFLSKEEIKSMGEDIKSRMGITGEKLDPNMDSKELDDIYYSEEFINEDNFNQLTVYGYDMDKNPVTIMIASYLEPYNKTPETTLFINLIKRGKNFNINGIMGRIEDIFKEFHKPVDITTCVIGTLEGRREDNVLEKNILKAMEKFKLRTVEKYIDQSIISYTAYTPLIDDSIFSGRKQVNLNLAIRYNEYENKSYIWIGTPIITTGY